MVVDIIIELNKRVLHVEVLGKTHLTKSGSTISSFFHDGAPVKPVPHRDLFLK